MLIVRSVSSAIGILIEWAQVCGSGSGKQEGTSEINVQCSSHLKKYNSALHFSFPFISDNCLLQTGDAGFCIPSSKRLFLVLTAFGSSYMSLRVCGDQANSPRCVCGNSSLFNRWGKNVNSNIDIQVYILFGKGYGSVIHILIWNSWRLDFVILSNI